MTERRAYTTQLGAGLGMLNETFELLRVVEPGDTQASLTARVVSRGVFARATARRARNIVVEMFAPRFLVRGDQPARWLQSLLTAHAPLEDLSQIFFLHTARAQAVFADFVMQVYWPRYSAGARVLNRAEAEAFIRRALDAGRMQQRWSEAMVSRVSGYVLGCCSDFGLLESSTRADRGIQRFSIRANVALYLAHDLHFSGSSDMNVVHHPDWQLFGLEPAEVLAQMKRLANDGHLLVQSAADLIQVSWKYRSMEDAIHAIA